VAGSSCRPVVAGLVVVLLGLAAAAAQAQPCTNATVMSQVTRWEFRGHMGHVTMPGVPQRAERTIIRTTDAWHQMFVSAYPEGRGGLIKGTGVILDPSEFTLPGAVPYKYDA
jgi:hypothetical protein